VGYAQIALVWWIFSPSVFSVRTRLVIGGVFSLTGGILMSISYYFNGNNSMFYVAQFFLDFDFAISTLLIIETSFT
jgi:hypothetical protein